MSTIVCVFFFDFVLRVCNLLFLFRLLYILPSSDKQQLTTIKHIPRKIIINTKHNSIQKQFKENLLINLLEFLVVFNVLKNKN